MTLAAGSSTTITVSVNASNGFASAVTISLKGLPAGVTVSPATPQVTAGNPQELTFTSATYVNFSPESVTLSGDSSNTSHSISLSLQVTPFAGNTSLPRTGYVRTDSATEYFLWPNLNWIVYDPITNRFFETDPATNRVIVLDAAKRKMIGSIAVPGAFGIDETPDHKTLYAGTQIGDVYAMNPVTMTVTKRYIASEIGPNGYRAYSVRALADGRLALLGGQGGIPGVDGYSGFALWNPYDNSFTAYGVNVAIPCGQKAGGIIGFSATGDHSLVLLVIGNRICTIDPVTGVANSYSGGYPVVSTPDGKSILALEAGTIEIPQYNTPPQIVVLDARTLTQKSTITLSADSTGDSAMIVSADSKTVYISEDPWTGIVYAYDIGSGKLLGWLSNLFVPPIVGGLASGPIFTPDFQAVDTTGLLAGPMEEGVGLLDTSALQTGPVGSDVLNGYLSPAAGPSAGGTTVQIPSWNNVDTIYFGAQKAASIEPVEGALFHAVTPPGTPGPADVYQLRADGTMQILPDAFSYGPVILEASPDSSTADGGGTGVLFGYGFGPVDQTAIPSDLEILVGGKNAEVTAYNPNAYGTQSPPFPLQSVTYTIPPGANGAQDITVSSSSGSATLSAGMHYLPAPQQFPSAGAKMAQGIYDTERDLYYFTDATEIRVFSKPAGQWLTPIHVPGAQRLWGIALSPDCSEVAVSDESGGTIFLIDPDTRAVTQSIHLTRYFPFAVAISDAGKVYFEGAYSNAARDSGSFFKLDPGTGQVTDYGITTQDHAPLVMAAISSDNSKVFSDSRGYVFSVDTATDKIQAASNYEAVYSGGYDVALSSGQTTVEASGFLYDSNLNAESSLAVNDRESFANISYVDGAKLNPDGSLLYQPSSEGIDVFDGRLGILLRRIALPFSLSQNYDALVGDGKDDVLVAITGTTGDGIAIIDLSSLQEPSPLPYEVASPAQRAVSQWQGPRTAVEPETSQNAENAIWLRIPHLSNLYPRRGQPVSSVPRIHRNR